MYIAKLKACYKHADFSDAKKDVEFKDQKKETLIELIDILDDPGSIQFLYNEHVLQESLIMIEANIFRTFTNKSKLFLVNRMISNQEDFKCGS